MSFQELALIQVRFRKKLRNLRPFYDAQAKKRKLSTLKQNAAVPQEVAERKTGDARSECSGPAGFAFLGDLGNRWREIGRAHV